MDAHGRRPPDPLGILGHYSHVVWYTGDDYVPREPDAPGGSGITKGAVDTQNAVRDFLNDGDNSSTRAPTVGENRFGFGLFDRSRKAITDAPAVVYYAPVGGGPAVGPIKARFESLAVKPQFQSQTSAREPDSASHVYVADVDFPKAGDYDVIGMARLRQQARGGTPRERADSREEGEHGARRGRPRAADPHPDSGGRGW